MSSESDSIFASILSEERWIREIDSNFPTQHIVDIDFGTPTCVFRVPKSLSETKAEAYVPQKLGLGPYHHLRPDFYMLQKHKIAAVRKFLSTKGRTSFARVVDGLIEWEPVLRACYDQYLDFDARTLARVLAIDGLYLLQFLEARKKGEDTEVEKFAGEILMLENQIPAVLLKKIMRVLELGPECVDSYCHAFCEAHSPLELEEQQPWYANNQLHLLDRLYYLIVNNRGIKIRTNESAVQETTFPIQEAMHPAEEIRRQKTGVAVGEPEGVSIRKAEVLAAEPGVLIRKAKVLAVEPGISIRKANVLAVEPGISTAKSEGLVAEPGISAGKAKGLVSEPGISIRKAEAPDGETEISIEKTEVSAAAGEAELSIEKTEVLVSVSASAGEAEVSAEAAVVCIDLVEPQALTKMAFVREGMSLKDVKDTLVFLGDRGMAGAQVAGKLIDLGEKMPLNMISGLAKKGDIDEQTPPVEEIDIPTVSQMTENLGIKFTLRPGGIRDMKYDDHNGEKRFYLPSIRLNANSEVILRNLLVYEAASVKPGSTLYLTEYMDLMCGMIDTAKDVAILKEKGIMKSELPDEDIAAIFNGIAKSTEKTNEICNINIEDINKSYQSLWIVRAKELLQKYVYSSWKFLSMLVSVVVLLLLTLQAFCSVFGCGRWFGVGTTTRIHHLLSDH